jgi:Neisseria PilC beta-propeller domain
MSTLKRILAVVAAMLVSQSTSAALLSIAQYPLFLTHRTLPNVLVIYDNSESMDGTMAGKLIAGDDPTTRGNIARSVIRSTITSFSGQFNWGLESFATYGYGLYSTYPYWLGNDQTMVFTDDCVPGDANGGVSASNGGLRCIQNPQWNGVSVGDQFVTYDRASDDPDINDVLYIGYFGSGAWASTAGGGAYNFFFTHNPGTDWDANMANYWTTLSFTPTDAGYIPYNPPISRQIYAYRAWGFYGGVSGQGVINEPILPPSLSGHLANIQAMLAPETPYGPEIKNAAVFTPLAGSMLTAYQYFTGGSTPIALSCQKSFIMLATDGNPTSDWWGNMYPLSQQQNSYNAVSNTWSFSPADNDVFGQITALRTVSVGGFTHDIQTYVVGMGDTVANPSSVAAMNKFAELGGTNTAYLAQDSTSLASAFQAIAVDIESKTAAASAVSLNTGSWGTGTNLYQARFNSGDWSGQLIAYLINSDGSIGAQQWDAGQIINGQNWDTGRTVLTYKPSSALGSRGISFRWPASYPGTPAATEMDPTQAALLNTPASITGGGMSNVALASNGGVASASSYYNSGYAPGGANNGDESGANWGSGGGGWNSAYYGNFPEWLQINFNGNKSITQAIVYSVQDQYWAPVPPTDTMTFNNYGLVNFAVQAWDGSAWTTLATVVGNNLVKRTVNFAAFTTDRIRIYVTASADGYSRMTELEVFGVAVASGPDGYGPQRVQWLRGNSANEVGTCGSCTPSFRSRPTSKLADIIHSAPTYVAAPGFGYPDSMEGSPYSAFATANVSRAAMIYVGANDGMLHGFSATTGREVLAYVPTSVYKNLSALTTASLSATPGEATAHHYQVDGSPTVADVYYSGAWHTLLVGGLGAGGQGIYALDVTDPSNFSEANASSIVRWEFSDADDADMGYTFAQPLLVKTNNGRWSVIVGNGYNNSEDDGQVSSSGHAVLFVLDAEDRHQHRQRRDTQRVVESDRGRHHRRRHCRRRLRGRSLRQPLEIRSFIVERRRVERRLWRDAAVLDVRPTDHRAPGRHAVYAGWLPRRFRHRSLRRHERWLDDGYAVLLWNSRQRGSGVRPVEPGSAIDRQQQRDRCRRQHVPAVHARSRPGDDRHPARRRQRHRADGLCREQEGLVHQPSLHRRACGKRRQHSRRPRGVQHAHSQHRPLRLRRLGLGDGVRRHDRQSQRHPNLRHQRRQGDIGGRPGPERDHRQRERALDLEHSGTGGISAHARTGAPELREQVRQHVGGFGLGHWRDRWTRDTGPRIVAANTVRDTP